MTELKNKVEAVLFASGKKVTYEDLARLCNSDITSVKKEVVILKKEYQDRDSPLMLSEEADGLKMTVRETYLPVVHGLVPETELGKSLLETLAVVAWKQPVIQSDLIKVRTNKAYEDVAELVEKGFISKEKHGRTFVLKTTSKFNEYFDLPGKEAIKRIFKEVQAEAELGEQRKMEDFAESTEKLDNLEVYEAEPLEQYEAEKTEKEEETAEEEQPAESEELAEKEEKELSEEEKEAVDEEKDEQ